MEENRKFWIGLAIITAASIGTAFSAPISDIFKGVAAIPAIGALSVALLQLVRDNAAHQRNIELQREQQFFNLGATSHMANTVFDKHVEFSEKYLKEVHSLVETLTREGPTKRALEHTGNLYNLRVEYTAWITPDIEEKLMPFEKGVRAMGTDAFLVSALSGEESRADAKQQKKRSEALDKMFEAFNTILDIKDRDTINASTSIVAIKGRIREILQINELVSIRKYLIERAAENKMS